MASLESGVGDTSPQLSARVEAQITPQYAFVLGVARSGTSAMARLLNAHRSVCIGMERYKHFYRRERCFPPSLLTKERFFSFRKDDTNTRTGKGNANWDNLYAAMEAKWDSATVIGDKESYQAIDYIAAEIPDCRIIFMLRDVNQVASSWNVRASRNVGAWPAKDDYRVAVHRWNEANALAEFYHAKLGNRMFFLDYEAFFSGTDERYANRVLKFLGLDQDDLVFMKAYRAMAKKYRDEIAPKGPLILKGQPEYIAGEANRETYGRLTDLAKAQLAAF